MKIQLTIVSRSTNLGTPTPIQGCQEERQLLDIKCLVEGSLALQNWGTRRLLHQMQSLSLMKALDRPIGRTRRVPPARAATRTGKNIFPRAWIQQIPSSVQVKITHHSRIVSPMMIPRCAG
ncbi:MAG: hypothetical protein P4L69_00095 [Desulfosporosinus sp.]|nr:hypothetical protein [Desulfosporosinus sp.]